MNAVQMAHRNWQLASVAKKQGFKNSLRIVMEARRTQKVGISLAFAVIEQETTNGANVYGHDDVPNRAPKGHLVTRRNWLNVYLPDRRRGMGSQGAGPPQLTYFAFQDAADLKGGCWIPKHAIRVAFEHLDHLILIYGKRKALAVYNGGNNPDYHYADQVLEREDKWHLRFVRAHLA